MDFLHIAKRTAHDKPHEQLHTLSTRLTDEIGHREGREIFGILNDFLDAYPVELFIDEARPRTIQLVRESARSNDDYPLILRKKLQRAPDSLSELEATRWCRNRYLNGIH